jgi:hypothetical protein
VFRWSHSAEDGRWLNGSWIAEAAPIPFCFVDGVLAETDGKVTFGLALVLRIVASLVCAVWTDPGVRSDP